MSDAAHQLELPAAPHARTPLFAVTPDHPNVAWLVRELKARGWLTRKEIAALAAGAGLKMSASYSERWVRALVNAAGADIVKGQHGFNHFDNCTVTEITHAANQSISQAKLMIQYGVALRRRVHQKVA